MREARCSVGKGRSEEKGETSRWVRAEASSKGFFFSVDAMCLGTSPGKIPYIAEQEEASGDSNRSSLFFLQAGFFSETALA